MFDARDELWNKAFDAYYDIFFEEILSSSTIQRWLWTDTVTKVLIAITATGSAVAGWKLWSKSGFMEIWLILAGVAAILSILHASLAVAERVRDWERSLGKFFELRVQMENFRNRMCIDPDFPIEIFFKQLEAFRQRYVEIVKESRDDILQTSCLKRFCQNELNTRLDKEIIKGEKGT